MKNKKFKQMLVDVVLQGRKAYWYGEESETFAAPSLREFEDEFGENFIEECEVGLAWKSYKTWWKPCLCEKAWDSDKGKYITKGKPVYNKQGELIEYWEYLPLINGVYGGKDDVAMLTTSYN